MKLSYYRNKADRALQDKYTDEHKKCELCGKPTSCLHHFFPKSSSSALRYDIDNLIPVCVGCHMKFHSKFSSDMIGNIIVKRGREWFLRLSQKKNAYTKTNIKYYQDIIDKLN